MEITGRTGLLILFALALGSCSETGQSPKQPRNLILISIDTLCADHLGSYGYERPTSPTIDAIAAEGLLFEDVSTPSPWTLPSHASMLTGLYPNRHGVKSHTQRLPGRVKTIAEMFKAHGYDTAGFVNSHNLSTRYGLDRGFGYFDYIKEDAGQTEPSLVGTRAMQWLKRGKEKPFFLFLHYYDVHSDYTSRPQYEDKFTHPYSGKADGTTSQLVSVRQGEGALDQTDAEHLIDLYDAGIRQMDDGIKQLVQFLKDNQIYDNSLLVITSDHGEEFLEHGGVLHGRTHYQEVMKIPWIMHGPSIPAGHRVRQMASLVDLMPTLLGLMGIAAPDGLDGMDLRPAWQQPGVPLDRQFIFAEADHNNTVDGKMIIDIKRAVRHPQFKLLYDRSTKDVQMFDLTQDPNETNNILALEQPMAEIMRTRLANFMNIQETGPSLSPLSEEEIQKLKNLGYLGN